jgi:hypothetical protein
MYIPNLHDIAQFNVADAREFVDFWDFVSAVDHGNGQPEHAGSRRKKKEEEKEKINYFMELNVGNDLTEENVHKLLEWKDPFHFTAARKARVLANLSLINRFRNDQIAEDEMQRAAAQVFPNGAVWNFFLFHIAKPHIFPIADVNVFRVCALHGREIKEPYTWKTYETYCDYFGLIADTVGVARTIANIRKLKRIDNALVKFGQFLGAYSPVVLKPVPPMPIRLPCQR